MPDVQEPDLPVDVPAGTAVDLGARGRGFVRMRSGPAGPPIVLLHGLTASSGINWVHVFEALPADRTVIAPDFRGHGRGPDAPRSLSIADHVEDLAALLDHLGIATATIVGFSMGGGIAQAFALAHPERLHALVLVSTTSRFRMGPITKWTYGWSALGAKGVRLLPGPMADALAPRFVPHHDPAVRRFILAETGRHRVRHLSRNARALSRFRTTPRLGEITVPTSVMISTEDRTIHPNAQRRLAELIPGAEVVESPTGHSGLLWESEVAVPRLLEAIERAERRASA